MSGHSVEERIDALGQQMERIDLMVAEIRSLVAELKALSVPVAFALPVAGGEEVTS